jgi:hypothetical protein
MIKNLFVLVCSLAIISCAGCKGNQESQEQETQATAVAPLTVEQAISMDREFMYLNHAKDYRWFETDLVLNDWFDSEDCDGSVESVLNVFQTVIQCSETTYDTMVYKITHEKGESLVDSVHGFYVEAVILNEEDIKLTYKEAYEVTTKVNLPKPHSKHCTLYKPVGPVDCNPQYVFGNTKQQIWVDAVTGEATDSNPAFKGYESSFGKPLGEWP